MDKTEELFPEHRIYTKLESLSGTTDFPVSDQAACLLEGMDILLTNLILCI